MTSKEVIALLKRDDWMVKTQKGSHMQFVHPTKKGKSALRTIRRPSSGNFEQYL